METKGRRRQPSIDLSTITTIHQPPPCDFEGTDALSVMAETARLRKLITKRGTLEILIPLCCTTNPVRYMTSIWAGSEYWFSYASSTI